MKKKKLNIRDSETIFITKFEYYNYHSNHNNAVDTDNNATAVKIVNRTDIESCNVV